MKLRYETAITTFAQLALTALFVVIGGVLDTVKSCHEGASSCVAGSFLWLVILIFMSGFFVCITALGYFAQTNRSSRLAKLLIVAELGVAAISFKLLSNPSSVLSGLGAFFILGLALWTIVLAFNITRAKGKRIVAKPRSRTGRLRQSKVRKS